MTDFFYRTEPRPVPPGEFPHWHDALALLNQDLAVTLPAQKPLQLLAFQYLTAGEQNVCVAMANGEWHGNHLPPDTATDPELALEAIADAAQETVCERLWQAWPVCTIHGLGMHPRAADGRLSWWCIGERQRPQTSHIRAAVGALDTVTRIPRPNRKKRRSS